MNNSYLIQWKSKVNGRKGRGTKLFDRAEAERLVEELNREYPQIEHSLLQVQPETPPTPAEPAVPPEEAESPLAPPPGALSPARTPSAGFTPYPCEAAPGMVIVKSD
jgi:hypothetical protein